MQGCRGIIQPGFPTETEAGQQFGGSSFSLDSGKEHRHTRRAQEPQRHGKFSVVSQVREAKEKSVK